MSSHKIEDPNAAAVTIRWFGQSYPVVRRCVSCAVNPDVVVFIGLCTITAKLEPDVFVAGVVRDVVHDQL